MLKSQSNIVFEGTEEELHEAFVRALHKHCGSYMMPLFIDPVRENAIFDQHDSVRNQKMIEYTNKNHEEARAVYDRLVDRILSELRGIPVKRR